MAYLPNGKRIDLLDPDPAGFTLEDVAWRLASIRRFNGALARPVSVLEHSLVVGALAPPSHRLPALLHDAHEWQVGDITRPLRLALAHLEPGFADALAVLERRHDLAVAMAVFAPIAGDATVAMAMELVAAMRADEVRDADAAAMRLEIEAMPPGGRWRANPHYPRFPFDEQALIWRWLDGVEAAAADWLEAR